MAGMPSRHWMLSCSWLPKQKQLTKSSKAWGGGLSFASLILPYRDAPANWNGPPVIAHTSRREAMHGILRHIASICYWMHDEGQHRTSSRRRYISCRHHITSSNIAGSPVCFWPIQRHWLVTHATLWGQSPCRDLSSRPAENEAGVMRTQRRHSTVLRCLKLPSNKVLTENGGLNWFQRLLALLRPKSWRYTSDFCSYHN
jgi:hypothetical protein